METQTTKVAKVGCFLAQLGVSIEELSTKFGDENGNIDINELDEILQFAGFAYDKFKIAYEDCLGKKFSIQIDGIGGKILELILELLSSQKQATPKK